MEVPIPGEFAGNGIATNRFFAKNGRLTVRGNESGVLSDDKRDFLARQRSEALAFSKRKASGRWLRQAWDLPMLSAISTGRQFHSAICSMSSGK